MKSVKRQRHAVRCSIATLLICLGLAGCGTTRFTDTSRTATEQLLVSSAVDDVISQLDFQLLGGKKVFFDATYLDTTTDKGYIISSIRQTLLAQGCLLTEKKDEASHVVEARCGAIGTDRHDLLFGVPQMQLPAVMPWQPVTSVPEIPFAKKTEQKGVAKIAVYAYNRQTGRAVLQSGIVQNSSSSRDLWVLGAGPFRSGSIRKKTEFAGEVLAVPFAKSDEALAAESPSPAIPVVQPAIWYEPAAKIPAHIKWPDTKSAK